MLVIIIAIIIITFAIAPSDGGCEVLAGRGGGVLQCQSWKDFDQWGQKDSVTTL